MAKRIVIADDSATIQRAFAMTFGAEDVTLVAARTADEAIKVARQIQPELVIADGMMPGPSGYDLCATIKGEPDLARTAVYILASAQQPYDESRGRQVGADGHFSKPFDTTALIERVHDALIRGPTEKAQPAAAAAPSADGDFGPPVPSDSRAGIPSGLAIPQASAYDDDEYGEISVDMAPAGVDMAPAGTNSGPVPVEVEYAATPSTPPPAATAVAAPRSSQSSPSISLPSGSLPSFSLPSGSPPAGRPGAFTPPPALTPPPASPASLFAPLGTPAPATAAPTSASGSASMRPSLIPGIRPGAVSPGRPGATPPVRPAGLTPSPVPRPPAPMSRTLMGLPAANVPIPGSSRSPSPPLSRPAPAPAASAPPRPSGAPGSGLLTPSPLFPPTPTSGGTPSPLFSPAAVAPTPDSVPQRSVTAVLSSAVSSVVGAAVDEKIAAISARGPEYAAIARLSREIIEQIVWEVVPELAEVIIREHVERHVRA